MSGSLGSFSYQLEFQLLQAVFNGLTYPISPNWIALFTTMPTPSAPGTEVTGGGYTRQMLSFDPVYSGPPPYTQNSVIIQWPAATASWGTLVAAGIFNQGSAGTMQAQGLLVDPADGVTPRPVTIGQGDVFRFPQAAIVVGFAQPGSATGISALPLLRLAPQILRPPPPQPYRAPA